MCGEHVDSSVDILRDKIRVKRDEIAQLHAKIKCRDKIKDEMVADNVIAERDAIVTDLVSTIKASGGATDWYESPVELVVNLVNDRDEVVEENAIAARRLDELEARTNRREQEWNHALVARAAKIKQLKAEVAKLSSTDTASLNAELKRSCEREKSINEKLSKLYKLQFEFSDALGELGVILSGE